MRILALGSSSRKTSRELRFDAGESAPGSLHRRPPSKVRAGPRGQPRGRAATSTRRALKLPRLETQGFFPPPQWRRWAGRWSSRRRRRTSLPEKASSWAAEISLAVGPMMEAAPLYRRQLSAELLPGARIPSLGRYLTNLEYLAKTNSGGRTRRYGGVLLARNSQETYFPTK